MSWLDCVDNTSNPNPTTASSNLCLRSTTLMLASMLDTAGYRTKAAGNIGESLVDVVMHDELDVIAVEVGAPQLPFVSSMSPVASVCLNIADDHIDHFGSFDAYVAAKAGVTMMSVSTRVRTTSLIELVMNLVVS